jgi:hypothetical protein
MLIAEDEERPAVAKNSATPDSWRRGCRRRREIPRFAFLPATAGKRQAGSE